MSTTSNMNQKIAVNVNQMNNELDHGQDKLIYLIINIIFNNNIKINMKQNTNYKIKKCS